MRKPLAIFDIDGTIFRDSLVIVLTWRLIRKGVFPAALKSKLNKYYYAWIDRKGTYEDYVNKVVEVYDKTVAGYRLEDIKKACEEVIKNYKDKVYVYTRELIKKLRKNHILVAISGSPMEIVREFNKYLRFDFILATEREIKNGVFTGKHLKIPGHDKKSALISFAKENKFNFKRSIGVGDTESDIGIFELVETPICFNPNLNLYKIAKKNKWKIVVERKDVIYHL